MIVLCLRCPANVAELVAVYELYEQHGGVHLPVPDPQELYRAMQSQEIVGLWDGDTPVAVGGTFPVAHAREPDGLPVAVYELAGMVVAPPWRGRGIQQVLTATRAVLLAGDQPYATCLISSVVEADSLSTTNMSKAGLQVVTDPPRWLVDVRRTWMAGTGADVTDFCLPGDAVPPLASRLLAQLASGAGSGERAFAIDDRELPQLRIGADTLASGGPDWPSVPPAVRLLGEPPNLIAWPR